MNQFANESFVRRNLPLFTAVVSIAVTPKVILDPINVPKLIALVILGLVLLAVLMPHFYNYFREFKLLTITVSLLFMDLIAIVLFSDNFSAQQIYGTFGRNTGLLFYLSLGIFMLISAFVSDFKTINRLLVFLILTGTVSAIYGILQYNGIDPAGFVGLYNPTIGFLGNPDFFSAFQGLALIACISRIFSPKNSTLVRVIMVTGSALMIFSLYLAGAKQGFLVGLIGIGSLVFFISWRKNQTVGKGILISSLAALLLLLLGLINKGPLAAFIYKSSLEARGYYWEAAWRMSTEHPLFGVGLDNFMYWYRRSRSLEATNWNPGVDTNAAHNVFLDYSSNGGFPFLMINLFLCIIVASAIISRLKARSKQDINFYVLCSIWIAFQAQSVISINQIGLAIWGWVIGGLIVGYSKNVKPDLSNSQIIGGSLKKNADRSSTSLVPAATVLRLVLAIIVGILICTPLWTSAYGYRIALESGKVDIIQNAAYLKPLDLVRMVQSARILNDNQFESQALEISEAAVKSFPDSYIAWKNLGACSGLTPERQAEVRKQLNRLDPLNPEHKLG